MKISTFGIFILLSMLAFLKTASSQTVELDNGILAVQFRKNVSNGKEYVEHKIYRYIDGNKKIIPSSTDVEKYYLFNLDNYELLCDGLGDPVETRFYSYWLEKGKEKIDDNKIRSVFATADTFECYPTSFSKNGNKIILICNNLQQGTLLAEWELLPGASFFNINLKFVPNDNHSYSLGYKLFLEKEISQINELLLPMLWQQKRFPQKPYTLFDNQCSTPVSIVEFEENGVRYSYSIAANLDSMSYEWPSQLKRHFGLQIRNDNGFVNPSISGPFIKHQENNLPIGLNFKIVIDTLCCYQSFKKSSEKFYQLSDYRENYKISLTDAIFNMIDLINDNEKSGWWKRAKSFYQIESKNGATQAAPLVMLSLANLTADTNFYKVRTIPTIEYLLSRSGWHFSPIPDNAGAHNPGKMSGPVGDFGSSFYSGCWEMTHRLMPIFYQTAFVDNSVRIANNGHTGTFSGWLSYYRATQNEEKLQEACNLADIYLDYHINKKATTPMSYFHFFLTSYIPDFESSIELYKYTGNKVYLDAAQRGADLLTTSIWSQPLVPEGNLTIHKNNTYEGDLPGHFLFKGAELFRLGYDLDPESSGYKTQINPPREKEVPAWVVSNVGMGFEQSGYIFSVHDYRRRDRLIFQAPWTPDFLRLAHYTGNKTYEMYARNAVVGRWGNYPGYYNTGFTDLYSSPNYPFTGPDISGIYYHHIPVHLGWSIDYLLSDAFLLSNGQVDFPYERQLGYAYFDFRVYGHKPGEAFGQKGLWLWFRKGLVDVSNSQINYITAHTENDLYVIFTNQSKYEQPFTCHVSGEVTGNMGRVYSNEGSKSIEINNNNFTLSLDGRSIAMVKIESSGIHFPEIQSCNDTLNLNGIESHLIKTTVTDKITLKGATIQMFPQFWSTYLWVEGDYNEIEGVTFSFSRDGVSYKEFEDTIYPFEFSSDLFNNDANPFYYYSKIKTKNGSIIKTNVQTLNVNIPTFSSNNILRSNTLKNEDVKVYPNPSNDIVNIVFERNIDDVTITIRDISGKLVFESKQNNVLKMNIDIADLSSGIYLIELKAVSGSKVFKVIKA